MGHAAFPFSVAKVYKKCIKQFCQIETIGDFLARVLNDNDKIVADYTNYPGTTISQSTVELVVEVLITQAMCNFG